MSRRVIGSAAQEHSSLRFVEDPLLPVQMERAPESPPSIKIRRAMLFGALRDLCATGKHAEQLRAQSWAWFDERVESKPGFSLDDCCLALALDKHVVQGVAKDVFCGVKSGEEFDWTSHMSTWRLWK